MIVFSQSVTRDIYLGDELCSDRCLEVFFFFFFPSNFSYYVDADRMTLIEVNLWRSAVHLPPQNRASQSDPALQGFVLPASDHLQVWRFQSFRAVLFSD